MASEGTMQGTDKIDGGEGADTANFTLKQAWAGFTTGSMQNVETVNLVNDTAAAVNFSAAGITGATKYTVDATKASVTLDNLNALAEVEVTGPADSATISVDYTTTSAVHTGSQTDTQKLKVTNVGTANTKTDGTDNAKVGTVTIAKVEALDITTAGTANTLNLAAVVDAKAIKVSGVGTTQINAVSAATTSFDASAATGKVIANLSGAAAGALASVKTGSGDDTVTVSAADLTINGVIEGGAGADKLVLDASAGAVVSSKMSGFETLDVKTTSALTFNGSNVTDLATINLSGIVGGASFINMGTNGATVSTSGDSDAAAVTLDTTGAVTYNMNASTAQLTAGTTAATAAAATTFSGASALTVNVNELVASAGTITAGAATSLTINNASKVVNVAELNILTSQFNADAATAVTLNSTGRVNGAIIHADKATTMTLNTGSTVSIADTLSLDAKKLITLNVNAKQDLTISEAAATSLNKVQNLNVTTAKAFAFGVDGGGADTDPLVDLASATLAGTASTSSASIQAIGTADSTKNVDVTATGLKAGLTVGNVNAGTGSSTLNFTAVTGNVSFGTVNADAGVTVTGTNVAGTVGVGNTSSVGNIAVDVTNAAKAVTLGTLNAGTTGNVTVLANNVAGVLTLGEITGNNVTVNHKSSGAQVDENGITARTSVNYTASDLFSDTVAITAGATSTAFTATLNGGALNEVFTIAGGVKQTGITVAGNLGAGTNLVTTTLANSDSVTGQTVSYAGLTSSATAGDDVFETVTIISAAVAGADVVTVTGSAKDDNVQVIVAANGTFNQAVTFTDTSSTDRDVIEFAGNFTQTYTNLNLTGIEVLDINGGDLTINASAISGDTMKIETAAALTLTGTAGADTINLSNISAFAADGTTATTDANFIVNADNGNDIIIGLKAGGAAYNLGDGNDVITVSQGANTITGGAGNDTINLGSGIDTVVFQTTAALNGADTINNFSVIDLIEFAFGDGGLASIAALRGTGASVQFDDATDALAIDANAGLVVNTAVASGLTTANVVTDFADNTGVAINDIFYYIASDNTNAVLYQIDTGAAAAIVESEVTILATLTGVTAANLTALTPANFLDFAAV